MQFGRQIAKVCDEVILIGEEQTKPIQAGLKKEKDSASIKRREALEAEVASLQEEGKALRSRYDNEKKAITEKLYENRSKRN